MKLISTLCLVLFLMISSLSFGQKNIQVGYDFGSFAHPSYSGRKNFNFVHRLNISGEYIFPSNILLSLNFGYDIHNIRYEKSYRVNYGTIKGIILDETYHRDLDIQTFKTGLSLGYNLEIGDASSIQVRLTYENYFVTNLSINTLTKEERFYDVPIEQIDDSQPISTKVEHDPNLIQIEKIRSPNRYFILSLHYKYKIKSYFISPQIGFSPWNEGFILPSGQSLLLAGIRLGYTFPQNSEKDEK